MLVNQGENVCVSVVETERNFSQKKMKSFSWHAPVWIEPMFGITPKPFDAVYMGSAFRPSGFLSDHDMVSPDCKGPVSLPGVSVIKAARFRMLPYKADHLTALAPLDRKYPDPPVTLMDAENDDLTGGTPTPFALPVPAKRGLVAFHRPFKGDPAFLLEGEHGPYQAKESLYGRRGNPNPEAHPVDRNAQDKKFKQPPFGCLRYSAGIPYRSPAVSSAAPPAFISSIGKVPGTSITTFRTPSHDQNILHFLVRFG